MDHGLGKNRRENKAQQGSSREHLLRTLALAMPPQDTTLISHTAELGSPWALPTHHRMFNSVSDTMKNL